MKKTKRKTFGKRQRFEIFKRDGFQCSYCGAHPPKAILHVDHIEPVSLGGSNDDDNLTTACQDCNLGKSNVPLTNVSESLSSRAKEVAEREAQLRGYQEIMRKKRERVKLDAWKVCFIFCDHFYDEREIRKDWFRSVSIFVEKIGLHECVEAMEIAVDRIRYREADCFKYFAGVCWRKNAQING